jgi:CRP/FNR family transcriptional regulator, anaerobic regulatory protein
VTVEPHKAIFRQGDETENIYVVRNGLLRLYQQHLNGRRQVIGFAKPGDLLLSPLSERNEYSADALDPVCLCHFRRQDFIAFFHRDPAFSAALAIAIHEELIRARQQIALLGQKRAEPKVAQFLLALLESYAWRNAEATLVPVRIPQADIADFLGMTVETVNRTLARFTRDAIISVAKRGIDSLTCGGSNKSRKAASLSVPLRRPFCWTEKETARHRRCPGAARSRTASAGRQPSLRDRHARSTCR